MSDYLLLGLIGAVLWPAGFICMCGPIRCYKLWRQGEADDGVGWFLIGLAVFGALLSVAVHAFHEANP